MGFDTTSREARDAEAKWLHESEEFDQEDDVVFWLDMVDGEISIGAYSAGFFLED
jgi:hypothetical protein